MELREDMSAAIMTASMTPRTPAGKSSFTSLTKAKLVQPPLKICPNAFYSRAGVILIPLNGKARLSIAVHLSDSSVFTLWFQLEDTGLLIGTLLLFDPVLFPIYEA